MLFLVYFALIFISTPTYFFFLLDSSIDLQAKKVKWLVSVLKEVTDGTGRKYDEIIANFCADPLQTKITIPSIELPGLRKWVHRRCEDIGLQTDQPPQPGSDAKFIIITKPKNWQMDWDSS